MLVDCCYAISQITISVIDEIFANITSPNFMSILDLTTGYFQIAMKPDDITKAAFITKNVRKNL